MLGRIIAQKTGESLGQQVIVDYRTGAGGLVAREYVADAALDGYTLLLAASGLGAIKSMRPEVTIDPWRDFTNCGADLDSGRLYSGFTPISFASFDHF